MTATMKAAVVREFRKPLVIEEMPIPVPGPGQVLIKYSRRPASAIPTCMR